MTKLPRAIWNIEDLTVVCRPSPDLREISPVERRRPGSSRLSRLDFPVPDWPVNMAVCQLAEFYRVLRPGGRLIVLEFSLPRNPALLVAYNFYFRRVMPRTAALIARDTSGAYRYLPQSVNTFIDRDGMARLYHDAGFTGFTLRPLTFGIAVAYRGDKPAA